MSECVVGLEDLGCAFADDDAGCHRVSGCYPGHDRPVGDAKVFYPIDFQLAVDHGHGVSAHLGGAGLMPIGRGGIPNEVLEFGTLEVAITFLLDPPPKTLPMEYGIERPLRWGLGWATKFQSRALPGSQATVLTNAFGEIAFKDDGFVGTRLHILFSFRCVGDSCRLA
jgi:hypothetical protein